MHELYLNSAKSINGAKRGPSNCTRHLRSPIAFVVFHSYAVRTHTMLLGRFPLKPRVQCARSQRKKANGIGFISGREREGKTFARLSVSGREEALRKPEQAGRQAAAFCSPRFLRQKSSRVRTSRGAVLPNDQTRQSRMPPWTGANQ